MIRSSFAQQRLWFFNQFEGGGATYNLPYAVRLRGVVDRAALGAALVDTVVRHESLRTVFVDEGGVPWQRVVELGEVEVPLSVVVVAESDLAGELAAAAGQGFDLAAELPLRAWLFELGPEDRVLLLVMHHIAVDGWSLAPLCRDLSVAYGARVAGLAPVWAPLPAQYADYAVWQRELLGDDCDEGSVASAQSRYWREALAGIPEELALPFDRPRPVVNSYRGDRVPVVLDAELHRSLAGLARQTGTSVFMVIQAGLAVLLTRLGAGHDIVVGAPTAGRTDEALHDLVGFFVNTLVLRVDTSGDPSFRALLERVREADLDAFSHQDLPFERLVELLNPPRSMSRHPLFQVMLTLEENTGDGLQLPGLHSTECPVDLPIAKFDLNLTLAEVPGAGLRGGGMIGHLEYATDLFDRGTIEALVEGLVSILAAAVVQPDGGIGAVTALPVLGHRIRQTEEGCVTARQVLLAESTDAQGPHTPSTVVMADEYPVAEGGRGDQRVLSVQDGAASESRRPERILVSEKERVLCGLFADALGLEQVGLHDNFFTLGGHSLLALKLINSVRSVFSVEVPLKALFQAQTVSSLMRVIDGGEVTRPPVVRQKRAGQVRSSFAQQRLWFFNQFEGGGATYNLPYAVRLRGVVDRAALGAALVDTVVRHESLRTVFVDEGGVPWQRVVELGEVEVPLSVVVVAESDLAGELAAAAGQGFDLAAELPLRAWLFELGPEDRVLLLVMHHIAVDGWSLAPLCRDLSVAYGARVAGLAPVWAPLPAQYADYAVWQRELLGDDCDEGSVASAQSRYWREALAGIPEELALPFDRPRPVVNSYRGDRVPVVLDAELHRSLAGLARQTGTSVFMVIQAGLAVLLTRLGAGHDIVVGAPTAGRTDEALHDLVGFFVNTLVLRVDTSGDPSFRALLERVREADLDAFSHQDLPFERLVELLNPPRSMSRHPLFQVMLTLNEFGSGLQLPGLHSTERPVDLPIARFDLWLGLAEAKSAEGECEGVRGELRYNSDLFNCSTVQGFADLYVALLRDFAADATSPVMPVASSRRPTQSQRKPFVHPAVPMS
ncbi:condensation domain-containing protein [Kitasatospora sp. NPDC002040]|uniref:condensation domain-containing protein n=1 Tax=Kitasatospora sp. NPDC002040 TaxID=3154661 RepID=UPI00331A8062